jgi:class 3 adenylate cyclase
MNFQTHPLLDRAWLELPRGAQHSFTAECRIGRNPKGNDLVLEERSVSSRHAIISNGPGGYTLVDQQSTNGTYLNGRPVLKPIRLEDGDEIRLAKDIILRFRCLREEPLTTPLDLPKATVPVAQFEERPCWLLLADVAGFSTLIAQRGDEAALQGLQAWIAGMRPLIEDNGGIINRYVGDAIFACWPCALSAPEVVLTAVRAIESFRAHSPVAFRIVLHHGSVFFTRSDVGEELAGQDVNFLFRSEKTAKLFKCSTMLSEAAVRTLQLEGRCEPAGRSAIEGIDGEFTFYRLPPKL